jgi:hypothetical protein
MPPKARCDLGADGIRTDKTVRLNPKTQGASGRPAHLWRVAAHQIRLKLMQFLKTQII